MILINKASIKKEIDTGDDYAYTKLCRLSRQGKIKRIARGKYTKSTDIYAIATSIHTPSYLSFWSCSQYKGYTEQMLNTIQVAATKRYKKLSYDGYIIEFIAVKDFFGYERREDMFIAEDEKLLIDALAHERLIGNFEEIEKLFIGAIIDKEKIISHLKRIGNKALTKRIGYMLERYRGIDISADFSIDRNYTRLTIYQERNVTDRKWRVKHDNTK